MTLSQPRRAARWREDVRPDTGDLPEHARELLIRIARLEGHVRGIRGMVRAGRPCVDVVQQVRAAQASLRSTRVLFMRRLLDRDLARPADLLPLMSGMTRTPDTKRDQIL